MPARPIPTAGGVARLASRVLMGACVSLPISPPDDLRAVGSPGALMLTMGITISCPYGLAG
jgi:hypothetical protein